MKGIKKNIAETCKLIQKLKENEHKRLLKTNQGNYMKEKCSSFYDSELRKRVEPWDANNIYRENLTIDWGRIKPIPVRWTPIKFYSWLRYYPHAPYATKRVMLAQSLIVRLCAVFVHSHTFSYNIWIWSSYPLPGRSIRHASPQVVYVLNPTEYPVLPSFTIGRNNNMHMGILHCWILITSHTPNPSTTTNISITT